MLRDDVQLISVDDHVIEHPRVWLDRLPKHLVDRAPRVVDTPDGRIMWTFEGREFTAIGLNAVAGRPFEERGTDPTSYDEMRPGCCDPKARLADMDTDGVHVQLCYPDFPGFAGRRFIRTKDRELGLACTVAWNDFILDEWCAAAPDRFIPLVLLPYWDVDACVVEIERTAAKGARGISFPEMPDANGLPSIHTDEWDRVFAAAQDAEMPLCMHFGTGGSVEIGKGRPMAMNWAVGGQRSMTACVDLLFSPTFHKFPGLKVLLAEGGIGWIPYILERADFVWDRHRWYVDVNRSVRPSDLFHDHIFGCFISDPAGIRDRHAIGVGQIMWEGDYPHADSNFPTARQQLAEELKAVDDDEATLIAEGNARRVFRFPRA